MFITEARQYFTGKTYYSHHKASPMWDAGAVVYWFKLVRGPDGVDWVPFKAADEAGIGRQIGLYDLNQDGLLDKDDAEQAIIRETEEETGYRLTNVQKVIETYMSPGSVTEILYFFVAEYSKEMKQSEGGGVDSEDIEVLEYNFQQALKMIDTGEIKDGKTIMLLQYALIRNLLSI